MIVLLKRSNPLLEQSLDAANFALHCTPAVNLFSRRTDRIPLSDEQFEYHVVADRTRPMDFEIYQIETATGYSAGPAANNSSNLSITRAISARPIAPAPITVTPRKTSAVLASA